MECGSGLGAISVLLLAAKTEITSPPAQYLQK
jgi:hypothetical protein